MTTVTPYLCAKDSAAALAFYAAAFGAEETTRWTDPDTGWLYDPFGHRWHLTGPIEPMS